MSIKTTILSIAVAIALYAPQAGLTQGNKITAEGFADFIKKKAQANHLSCIVDSDYRSQFHIDEYRCGKKEDLEKKLPYRLFQPDYPYTIFRVMWYYERGKTIKNASKEEKILFSIGIKFVNHKIPKGTSTKEAFIIDDDSRHLWGALEKYTCFRMNYDRSVSKKSCR